MKPSKLIFFICQLFAFSFLSHASTTTNDHSAFSIKRIENGLTEKLKINGQTIKKYSIAERLAHYNIPGLSIAVTYKDEVLWAKAFGMADIAQKRRMNTETMLLAGSISKPISALRALQLHEDKKLFLDSNINDNLKGWKVPENEFTKKEKVTLRRILDHTAGLTVWGFPGYDKGDEIPSTIAVLDGKGNTEPVRVYKTPGENWQYSGGGYTVMQLAIEQIDGNFVDSLKKNVLDPLKMQKSTFANPLPNNYHDLAATGYRRNGIEVEGKWPIYPEMAAAGLWTTPSQLVRYASHIQTILALQKDGVITFATAEEMLTPNKNEHGLGPVVNEHTFGHGGADEGFRAVLTAWKNHPYAVVAMVNSDNGRILEEVVRSVANEFSLPGYEHVTRTQINLPIEILKRFVGTFDSEEMGPVKFSLIEGGLLAEAPDIEFTAKIFPQSENEFFQEGNGMLATFTLNADGPDTLYWYGITATRN